MKSAAKKMASKGNFKPEAKPPARAQVKRGLGKGLSALMSESYGIAEVEEASAKESAKEGKGRGQGKQTLPIAQIVSGTFQPRSHFEDSALSELTDSVRAHGIMQPILVRPKDDGYEIIAGERRWRAARMAGLSEIPALVRDLTDEEALEFALIENIQRENLHPLEEAAGYLRLMNEFSYTQEQVATTVNKSRSHVANLLRLLDLPNEVRMLFSENRISMGHARALIGAEAGVMLAHEVADKGLSVRQTERLVRSGNLLRFPDARKTRDKAGEPAPQPAYAQPALAQQHYVRPKDPDILALEETLSENLGLKVSIVDRGQSGEITIAYESLEQLDEILRRLGGSI